MRRHGIVPDIKINKEERCPESNTSLQMMASYYKTIEEIEEQCTVNGKLDVDKYVDELLNRDFHTDENEKLHKIFYG